MAVEVSPLVFTCLEGRDEAKLLKVMLISAWGLTSFVWEFVTAHHAWHAKGGWRRWQEEGAVSDGTVAVRLSVGAVAALASAAIPVAGLGERMALSLNLILPHHLHVIPLHHLEEVRWKLVKIWHLRPSKHIPLQAWWVAGITLVKVLQVASALLLLVLVLSLLLAAAGALEETHIALIFELLINDDVVRDVVDVVWTFGLLIHSLVFGWYH